MEGTLTFSLFYSLSQKFHDVFLPNSHQMFLFPKGSFSNGSVIKKSIEKDTANTSSTTKVENEKLVELTRVENETLVELFDPITVEPSFVRDISVFPKSYYFIHFHKKFSFLKSQIDPQYLT